MRKKIASFLLLVLMTTSLLGFQVVFFSSQTLAAPCQPKQQILGLPTWYKYLPGETDQFGRCNPQLNDVNGSLPIGVAVLEVLLRFAGIVAVAMVFYGSFKFITSAGNGEAAAGGRKTVINAMVGLIIVIISTGVVSYIGNSIR